jgi:hypothetical protein
MCDEILASGQAEAAYGVWRFTVEFRPPKSWN